MKGSVEFRFSFDPNDTMLLPLEGKRMQCPCCDDEFTAFPDGAVACSRCVGTMQGKHLRDRQLQFARLEKASFVGRESHVTNSSVVTRHLLD